MFTPEMFLSAYDEGVEISERDLLQYAYCGEIIDQGENRRWSRTIVSVVEVGGRYFEILWEEGLTENQPDVCFYQPREVSKLEYIKIIPAQEVTVIEWKGLEEE